MKFTLEVRVNLFDKDRKFVWNTISIDWLMFSFRFSHQVGERSETSFNGHHSSKLTRNNVIHGFSWPATKETSKQGPNKARSSKNYARKRNCASKYLWAMCWDLMFRNTRDKLQAKTESVSFIFTSFTSSWYSFRLPSSFHYNSLLTTPNVGFIF